MTLRAIRQRLPVLSTVLVLAAAGCAGAQATAEPIVLGSEAPTPEPIVTWSEAPTPPNPEPSTDVPTAAPTPLASTTQAAGGESRQPAVETVLAQLERIPVKGRAPQTGYERDLFGSGWKDPDRNGCDARNDVLGRDLTGTTAQPGTQGCVIASGTLEDPFTGETIHFVRGQGTSTLVQIDHLVALSDAWQKGAQQMGADERVEFANDPLNLLAVDGSTNAAKGDGDAATWLPPNRAFRCDYVARQTAVKAKYGLWMTRAEHDAIERLITAQCPEQKITVG